MTFGLLTRYAHGLPRQHLLAPLQSGAVGPSAVLMDQRDGAFTALPPMRSSFSISHARTKELVACTVVAKSPTPRQLILHLRAEHSL